MKIGNLDVGGNAPCRVVAEIGNAHNGDIQRAMRLIDAAVDAGADLIKFQAYTPDELVALRGDGPAPEPWGSQGWTMRRLYEKAQTPLEWIGPLMNLARCKYGVPAFASVFGEESFAAMERIDCPAYKTASLDFNSGIVDDLVRKTGKPIIASTPGALPRVADPGVEFLYCPPFYPQTEFHLSNIRHGFLGFSYHGTRIDPPVLAVAAGAKMVEVHFMLDDAPSELEANVSLGERQFARMVRAIRRVETML